MSIERLLHPDVLALLIPIAAIVMGGCVAIAVLVIRHRERMAMIEQGMDPDDPARSQDKGESEGPPR